MSHRSEALASHLEAGAAAPAGFASTLSETEWQTRLPASLLASSSSRTTRCDTVIAIRPESGRRLAAVKRQAGKR